MVCVQLTHGHVAHRLKASQAHPDPVFCSLGLMDGARGAHPEASAEVLPGEVYELRLALEKGMQ